MGTGNCVPHRTIWSWFTGCWWVGCYIWYSEEGTARGRSLPRHLLTVPNLTAHPLTASVPMTVSLHNGPVLCGFNVTIKGLKCSQTVGSRDGPWLCPGLAGEANYDNVCISVHIKIEVSYRITKYNIHIFRTGMNDFSMYFTVHWQTVVCMSWCTHPLIFVGKCCCCCCCCCYCVQRCTCIFELKLCFAAVVVSRTPESVVVTVQGWACRISVRF